MTTLHPVYTTNPQILIRRIAKWIQNYANNAGITSLVVGASGGIDSSVVLRLCEETHGLSIHAIAMPMWLYDNSGDPGALHRAMELCVGRPRIQFDIVEIGRIVEAYVKQGIIVNRLLEGNLRARIRANILYNRAGAYNGLVVGTGNMDEDEIGYMTKGGDGLVDLCPLSKLHKSKVYEMAAFLNIPSSIRLVEPTAGLWAGQTDESELGMTYDEIAWAIDYDDLDLDRSVPAKSQEVLTKVRDLRRKNAHKLCYPPVFDPEKDEIDVV